MMVTKYILFSISFLGLVIFFKEQLKVRIAFAPVLSVASIVCILNFAGLLGDLKYTSYAVCALGLLFVLYNIARGKFQKAMKLFNDGTFLVFLAFIAILGVLLYNLHLSHYDNFSHWALVVKEMYILDGMPVASSAELMDFTGYPLGSALFIYYGCAIMGISESLMLVMQGIFLVACMLPLLAFNDKFKLTITPVALLIYVSLLIEPKVFNLLVDVLLACLGFASLMAIIYYRENIKKAFFISLPLVIALVLVKNSGIFFAAADALLLLYLAIKSKTVKRNLIYAILLGAAAVGTVLLWNMHCSAVFPETVGKHSMTGSNFSSILGEKSLGDIKDIALMMLKRLIDTGDIFIKAMIAVNAVAFCGLMWRRFVQEKEYKITKVAVVLDITFIVYYIGIFAMYVFSMPMEEASYLAGFERYIATIVLYIVLIFAAYWVAIANHDKPSPHKINRYGLVFLVGFALITFSILGTGNYNIIKTRNEYKNTYPNNALMPENFSRPDEAYVMYVPEKYRDYYQTAYFNYLLKYKVYTGSCYPFLVGDLEKPYDESVIELIRVYDYFIIYEEDEYIKEFAVKYLGRTEDIAGMYRIDDFIGDP